MHSACVTQLLDLSAFGEFTNESTDWFELRNLQWRASLSRCVSWCRTYRCVWWRSRSDTPCSTQTAHPSKTLRWKAMSLSSFPNISDPPCGDGGGRPSSVMSLGVTSVGGHSHGHPASPIGVGSSWEDIDPRSPEPLVVRGGWLWLIWVVRWTT